MGFIFVVFLLVSLWLVAILHGRTVTYGNTVRVRSSVSHIDGDSASRF